MAVRNGHRMVNLTDLRIAETRDLPMKERHALHTEMNQLDHHMVDQKGYLLGARDRTMGVQIDPHRSGMLDPLNGGGTHMGETLTEEKTTELHLKHGDHLHMK